MDAAVTMSPAHTPETQSISRQNTIPPISASINVEKETLLVKLHSSPLRRALCLSPLVITSLCSWVLGNEPPRTRATEDWPTWHVTALPEEGHCVPYDANGCIFWKGRYHLMYIFQDQTLPKDGLSWGHTSSTDLVNWTFHSAAIVPEKGDADTEIT